MTGALGNQLYAANEIGTAERIADEWRSSLCWSEEMHCWLVRPEGSITWQTDVMVERTSKAIDTAQRMAIDYPQVKQFLKPTFIRNSLDFAKPYLAVKLSDFDSNPWALVTPGGLINLQNFDYIADQLITQKYMMTTRVTPERMETPLWDAHLWTMCHGDIELIAYLKRLAGITLLGDQNLKPHVAPQLNGLGRNGKGVFMQALGWALGDYCKFASSRLLTTTENAHTTEQASLRGMRFVVVEEVKRINSSILKDLTGGGMMNARKIRQDDIEFLKTWTLWFNNNGPMSFTGDTSDGLWNRVKTINLGQGIPVKQRVDDMAEQLKDEGPGILQWALDGLQEFYELGKTLCDPQSVLDASELRRYDSDPLRIFVEENYDVDPNAKILGSTFVDHYEIWMKNKGERSGGMKSVFADLRDRLGFEVRKATANKTYVFGLQRKAITFADLPGQYN